VPAWFRGVSLIMQTMGQMRVQYQKKNESGGNYVEDDFREAGRLNYLLQVRPNPLMTASQMQEQIEFRKIYYGNAFVYIEREGGWPKNIWLCTGGGYDPISNTYHLVYNRDHMPAKMIDAPAEDVLHFKNIFMTDDFYMGIPTIVYAMKTLSIAATADEQALKDMAKGGKHKVIIQEEKAPTMGMKGRANRDELKKVKDQFAADWNQGDFILLDNVADTKIISQTAAELRLLENRGFEVSDIARILGIPRIMMMEDQGSSYKMPEHATQEFLLRTIQPRIRSYEDEFNSKMLSEYDFGKRRIHVCELALRRLDAKGQAEIDLLHLQTGWSPNEIRAQYDMPSVKNGDDHYISTNLAVAGSEKVTRNGAENSKQREITKPIDDPKDEE
jgi:HK97 family phage portal protein